MVKNPHTAPKASVLQGVGGGHDLESGYFVAEQAGFVGHHKLLSAVLTNTIYCKRGRGSLRKLKRDCQEKTTREVLFLSIWVYGLCGDAKYIGKGGGDGRDIGWRAWTIGEGRSSEPRISSQARDSAA